MIPVKSMPLWRGEYPNGTAYAGFNTLDEANGAIALMNDTRLHGKPLAAHHHVPYSPKVPEIKENDDNASIHNKEKTVAFDDEGCIEFEFVEFNTKAIHKDFEEFFEGLTVKSLTYVIQPRFIVHKHKRAYVRVCKKNASDEEKEDEKFDPVELLEKLKLKRLAGEPVSIRFA